MSNEYQHGVSRRDLMGRGALLAGGMTGATALLAGCGGKGADTAAEGESGSVGGRGKRVIFVAHDTNPFFVPVKEGFLGFGKAMGWKAEYLAPPKQDTPAVVNLQRNALNKKPDGVVFTRIDDKSFDDNIKSALDAEIKVVLSNVASAGYEKLGVAFVGQDFVPAGTICGFEVAKRARERSGRSDGLVVAGNFAPGNSALEDRITGIKRGVELHNGQHGTSYRAEVLVTSTDEAEAIGRIGAKYTKDGGQIVGWAMSELTHQYVAKVGKDKGFTGKVAVAGFDLVAPVLEGIKDGSIDFTLDQNPWAQGWIAAALIAMELDPGYEPKDYDTGAAVIDKTNVDQVIEREKRFA